MGQALTAFEFASFRSFVLAVGDTGYLGLSEQNLAGHNWHIVVGRSVSAADNAAEGRNEQVARRCKSFQQDLMHLAYFCGSTGKARSTDAVTEDYSHQLYAGCMS